MLRNKTILITGASGGLGQSLAKTYAKQGGKIINLSRNLEKMIKLNNTLNTINQQENLYFKTDISKIQ